MVDIHFGWKCCDAVQYWTFEKMPKASTSWIYNHFLYSHLKFFLLSQVRLCVLSQPVLCKNINVFKTFNQTPRRSSLLMLRVWTDVKLQLVDRGVWWQGGSCSISMQHSSVRDNSSSRCCLNTFSLIKNLFDWISTEKIQHWGTFWQTPSIST